MKLVGILCIAGVCISTGMMASRHIRDEARYVARLVMLLEDLRIYIHYQCLPLEELIAKLADHPQYQDFVFLQRTKAAFHSDRLPMAIWCEQVRGDPWVSAPAGEILLSLGSVLGATDIEGQLSALQSHAIQMQKLAEETKERNGKRAALSCQLGFLSAAMLAVLLL